MRLPKHWLFVFALCFSLNSKAEGDVLLLKAIMEEPPNTSKGVPRPKPGMHMNDVRKVFGDPLSETKPIGNPPILQWKYEGYVVFFENNFVINTVMAKPVN